MPAGKTPPTGVNGSSFFLSAHYGPARRAFLRPNLHYAQREDPLRKIKGGAGEREAD